MKDVISPPSYKVGGRMTLHTPHLKKWGGFDPRPPPKDAHGVHNQKENCRYDRIPSNLKGIGKKWQHDQNGNTIKMATRSK